MGAYVVAGDVPQWRGFELGNRAKPVTAQRFLALWAVRERSGDHRHPTKQAGPGSQATGPDDLATTLPHLFIGDLGWGYQILRELVHGIPSTGKDVCIGTVGGPISFTTRRSRMKHQGD